MSAHRDGVGISPREVSLPAGHPLARAAWPSVIVGVLALAAAWLLGGGSPRFYAAYLVAYLYGLTVALGGLFFVLLQFATRSGWSVTVRRLGEHVMGTLPLFVVLFVPVALGAPELFTWMAPGAAAHDPNLAGKAAFLNPGFFYLRSAAYLVLWGAMGWWFRRRSLAQDSTGDPKVTRLLQSASAPALLVYAITLTLASFDWIMSLDPHWYSTIFGVYVFAGSTVAIFALVILLAVVLERRGPLAGVITPEHYHDLGKMLFSFVAFWAYIAFSQYMLMWYGNIPEETVWWGQRLGHGWLGFSVGLALVNFVLPFFFLLSRDVKRHRVTIGIAAVWLLAAHYVDVYWLVMPSLAAHGVGGLGSGFRLDWLDLLALVAVVGLFLGTLGLLMRRSALVPVADPRLPESLSFENM